MPWPAYFGGAASEGTVYVRERDFHECLARHKPAGLAWRYGRCKSRQHWTTYCPNKTLTYKNLDRLGPRSEEQFWKIMDEAKAADLNPPTSAADLFMSVHHKRPPRRGVLEPFRAFRFGGWQEVVRANLQHGEYRGKVYHYDLNRAYQWAACADPGLPKLETAHYTKDFSLPWAVYLVMLKANALPYHKAPGLHMVTSEERDCFGLQGKAWPLWGVAFRGSVDLTPTFKEVEQKFPTMAKKISQTFWGQWNTRNAPEQVSWRNGECIREMHNPFFNPIWSAFVTSRVKMRLAMYLRWTLHIFVDALHMTEPLNIGSECGDWKLVDEYDGAWFRAPGNWGVGPYVMRHCGRGSVAVLDDEAKRTVESRAEALRWLRRAERFHRETFPTQEGEHHAG